MMQDNPVSAEFARRVWRRQEQERQWEDFRRKHLRHFRPRRDERGRVIFVAVNRKTGRAERLPPGTRRKGVPLYVTRQGRLEPVFEHKRRDTAAGFQKLSPRQFDPVGMVAGASKRRRIVRAERLWRAQYRPVTPLQKPPRGKRQVQRRTPFWDEVQTVRRQAGEVHWDAVARQVAQALQTAMRGELKRDRQVYVHFHVKGVAANGRVFVWDDRVYFGQSQLQEMMSRSFYLPFILRKCYAFFADLLNQAGYVTRGSREFVSKLPWNRGKPRSEWLDSRQMAWEKRDVEDDRVVRIDEVWFQLERVKIVQ